MLLEYGYVRCRGCGATKRALWPFSPRARLPQLKSPLQRFIGHNLNGKGVLYCNSWNATWHLYGLVSQASCFTLEGVGKLTTILCRTQAALRVSEISGAIFKKYKTYPDALEAFNNAARNGKVRAVQVDLEPEAESPPGSRVREQAPHGSAVVRPILHSVPRPGRSFHRGRATRSTGGGMMPSESMYASQSDLAERIGHRPIGTEPREYQSFDQPPRKVPACHVQNEAV